MHSWSILYIFAAMCYTLMPLMLWIMESASDSDSFDALLADLVITEVTIGVE